MSDLAPQGWSVQGHDAGPRAVGGPSELQQFFHSCPVGLAEVEPSGRVLVINPAAVSLLAPAMPTPDFRDLGAVLRRLVPDLAAAMAQEGPEGPVGREVACTLPSGDTWVAVQAVRLDPDRLMVVVHDVTHEQRLARRDAQAALEINDTVVQTLVAAETALDLGRSQLGRRLVGEASRASRTWIGQQLEASGGARPGSVRRSRPLRRSDGDGEQSGDR